MWSQSTNVTDGWTDGQTDGRHAIPKPRICTKVRCAVTMSWRFELQSSETASKLTKLTWALRAVLKLYCVVVNFYLCVYRRVKNGVLEWLTVVYGVKELDDCMWQSFEISSMDLVLCFLLSSKQALRECKFFASYHIPRIVPGWVELRVFTVTQYHGCTPTCLLLKCSHQFRQRLQYMHESFVRISILGWQRKTDLIARLIDRMTASSRRNIGAAFDEINDYKRDEAQAVTTVVNSATCEPKSRLSFSSCCGLRDGLGRANT